MTYYENDPTFEPKYFQLPFTEFKTPLDLWLIVKAILDCTTKRDYLSIVYVESNTHDNTKPIRFCILRPYMVNGTLISKLWVIRNFIKILSLYLTWIITYLHR